jgi:hypothetical protein
MSLLIFSIPDILNGFGMLEHILLRVAVLTVFLIGAGRVLQSELMSLIGRTRSSRAKLKIGNKSVEVDLGDEFSVRRGIEILSEGSDSAKKEK